jgi:hypothetical protein
MELDWIPYLFGVGMLVASGLIFAATIVFLAVDQDQP